jgi:hypothetical protein
MTLDPVDWPSVTCVPGSAGAAGAAAAVVADDLTDTVGRMPAALAAKLAPVDEMLVMD